MQFVRSSLRVCAESRDSKRGWSVSGRRRYNKKGSKAVFARCSLVQVHTRSSLISSDTKKKVHVTPREEVTTDDGGAEVKTRHCARILRGTNLEKEKQSPSTVVDSTGGESSCVSSISNRKSLSFSHRAPTAEVLSTRWPKRGLEP